MNTNSKGSGILLHPTSLPGPYGIGDLGSASREFVEKLARMEQSYWQILPLGPTDFTNSPYSALSTFAGNPLLISPEELMYKQLLEEEELTQFKIENTGKVNFPQVRRKKSKMLELVCAEFRNRASHGLIEKYSQFLHNEKYWLQDYAEFCTLKNINKGLPWSEWKVQEIPDGVSDEFPKVIQFLFHIQWKKLQDYCREYNIKFIGDMPIYVGYDSADVWANRGLFQLTPEGEMEFQAGCPPCKYEDDGQIWGNPLYNWDAHEKDNFSWWKMRFQKLLQQVDIIRLDHFIGFAKYYKIPIESKTARNGEWVSAPGEKLFSSLKDTLHKGNVIAEDLGDITQEVHELRRSFDFPGMRVMHFEFPEKIAQDDIPSHTVLYLGTHDNNTHAGWVEGLTNIELKNYEVCMETITSVDANTFDSYKNFEELTPLRWILNTEADKVILQLQDVLNLDGRARMNTPGTVSDANWTWRYQDDTLHDPRMYRIRTITKKCNRHQLPVRIDIEKEECIFELGEF